MSIPDERGAPELSSLPAPDVAGALFELLIRLIRDQASDLRLLELASRNAEDMGARNERLADELVASFPSTARADAIGFVERASKLLAGSEGENESGPDVVDRAYGLVADLAGRLESDSEVVAFSGQLLRASLDDPDLDRMLGTLLVSTVTTFEAWMMYMARLLSWHDPTTLLEGESVTCPRPPVPVETATDEQKSEIEEVLSKKLRGGWQAWSKFFEARLGVSFASQDPLILRAYTVRNNLVHRGAMGVGWLGEHEESGRADAHAAGTDFIASVADRLLLAAAEVTFNALSTVGCEKPQNNGTRLLNLRYELLLRHRYECVADSIQLDAKTVFVNERDRLNANVNRWIALKRLGRRVDYMRELSRGRGKYPGTIYEIAQSILMGRTREASRRAAVLREAGEISDREWHTWPLFDDIREAAADA